MIVDEAKTWTGVPYFNGGGPNSTKEKADCSGATWNIYKNAGFPYKYSPASSFGKSDRFKPVPGNIPQQGDVGRWSGHVLIYDVNAGGKNDSWSARREGINFGPAQSAWWGPNVTWYRYDKPE